jgi:hypothetical protein
MVGRSRFGGVTPQVQLQPVRFAAKGPFSYCSFRPQQAVPHNPNDLWRANRPVAPTVQIHPMHNHLHQMSDGDIKPLSGGKRPGRSTKADPRIRAFVASLAPDLFVPEAFIAWDGIATELVRLGPAIKALEARNRPVTREILARQLLTEPTLTEVIGLLFAASSGAGFEDGRELLGGVPNTLKAARQMAGLAVDLGLHRLVPRGGSVQSLVQVALVAEDARRRRFRRLRIARAKEKRIVERAIHRANRGSAVQLTLGNKWSESPPDVARAVDYVALANGKPVAAMISVFQATSGGRQQRDLTLTYPSLQATLDQVPMHLVLLADGRGFAQTPVRTLEALFERVASCMTLSQARGGMLADALIAATRADGRRQSMDAPVSLIIESALGSGAKVAAADLPVPMEAARLALARFADARRDLALTLAPGGESVTWQRGSSVDRAIALMKTFNGADAIQLLADLVGAEATMSPTVPPFKAVATLRRDADQVLPSAWTVAACFGAADSSTLRQVARIALTAAPDSKLGVLIVPEDAAKLDSIEQTRLQSRLPANVLVITTRHLTDLARGALTPRDALVGMLLEQADLAKASPFVLTSVTPQRMFYGRDAEEATLLATLGTNSVALLGGRRIGKTSLMRHVESALREADFAPRFLDCQTVRNWAGFVVRAKQEWHIDLPPVFHPNSLIELASALAGAERGRVVFLLDEIDHLLLWDLQKHEGHVPEAFFRACRTVSQEGMAQFVFSGERTIANRLWDPRSPHWNFCRPVPLRQLSREAAEQLLIRPINSLQIAIDAPEDFAHLIWQVTSGHPQIIQWLGDALVRSVNQKAKDARHALSLVDLKSIIESYEYREHYLETYWGQASSLERAATIWSFDVTVSPDSVARKLRARGKTASEDDTNEALRMLELYGILDQDPAGYRLRAGWFPTALMAYGGHAAAIERYLSRLE